MEKKKIVGSGQSRFFVPVFLFSLCKGERRDVPENGFPTTFMVDEPTELWYTISRIKLIEGANP